MFDVSDVVDSLSTSTYVVTRRVAVDPIGGKRQSPTLSTLNVVAAVQPVGGLQLQRLPEGMRELEVIAIWTKTLLRTAGTGVEPDSIAYDGKDYEIQVVENWLANGNYYKALAAKVGR